jgi:hypothetical protein
LNLIRALASKWFGCNLHEVDPGKAYRVARGRLGDADFANLLRRLGIRTALDLRRPNSCDGSSGPVDFAALGTRYENVHLRSSALPFPAALAEFVRILDGDEAPFLFYCKRGTDKSGFASMLYLMLEKREPLEAARSHLSFIPYGHRKSRHGGPWHFMRLLKAAMPVTDLRAWIRDAYPALFAREMNGAAAPEAAEDE